MHVAFNHGLYRPHPVFLGALPAVDAEAYATLDASISGFYNSLRQAAAGNREAMLASALASLTSGAARAADAAYSKAKAAGQSEEAAKTAAAEVIRYYKGMEAAYRKAAFDVALEAERAEAAAISAKARHARELLDEGFGLESREPSSGFPLLPVALAVGALYLAWKG